jgi:DNA repair protein RadD
MKMRAYQEEAIDSIYSFIEDCYEGEHPIAAMPTASGKTPIICGLIERVLSEAPNEKILVLSHVKEILGQDYDAIAEYFSSRKIGLYSSGMDSKTIEQITVAGIQSVHKKSELFEDFGFVIIDECHLIPMGEDTMYRRFLAELEGATYVGLTATPYRLDHGYLHKGKDRLFTDVVIDYTRGEKFTSLVDEGYLSNIFIKKTLMEMDTSGIKETNGDFNNGELDAEFNQDAITAVAIDEIIKYGKNYKQWLIFAINIDHAESITATLISKGITAVCIHSEMGANRDEEIENIRAGKYRAVVNVNILTTGFNVKGIDLVALLRPTSSVVLHVQMIGRILRVLYALGYPLDTPEQRLEAIKQSTKPHGLVLDFAGNTHRLGPINNVRIKKKRGEKIDPDDVDDLDNGLDEARTKDCPSCLLIVEPKEKICPACGFNFELKTKLEKEAAELEIIQRKIEEQEKFIADNPEETIQQALDRLAAREAKKAWLNVFNVTYNLHNKAGKKSSMKVTYDCGLQTFSEWVTPDHDGFALTRARMWMKKRLPVGMKNLSLSELLVNQDLLLRPIRIRVDTNERYTEIIDQEFESA